MHFWRDETSTIFSSFFIIFIIFSSFCGLSRKIVKNGEKCYKNGRRSMRVCDVEQINSNGRVDHSFCKVSKSNGRVDHSFLEGLQTRSLCRPFVFQRPPNSIIVSTIVFGSFPKRTHHVEHLFSEADEHEFLRQSCAGDNCGVVRVQIGSALDVNHVMLEWTRESR